MFREAGLDPDKPPTSLAELEAMNEVLTIVDVRRDGQTVRVRYNELTDAEKEAKDFDIFEMGFTPNEPGWWTGYNGFWFVMFTGLLTTIFGMAMVIKHDHEEKLRSRKE